MEDLFWEDILFLTLLPYQLLPLLLRQPLLQLPLLPPVSTQTLLGIARQANKNKQKECESGPAAFALF